MKGKKRGMAQSIMYGIYSKFNQVIYTSVGYESPCRARAAEPEI